MAKSTTDFQDMLVRSVRYEAVDVVSLELEPCSGPLAGWEAGAHLDVVVGDGSTRQYSLCGAPGDSSYRIAVLREAQGRGGSEYLHRSVRPGDVLRVKGPRNHFALEPAARYQFVAGGIGITPLLPMVRELSESGAVWQLHYFGSDLERMPFLDVLSRWGDAVSVYPREQHGRPSLAEVLPDPGSDQLVYLCGPQRMLDDAREILLLRGLDGCLRTEVFAAPAVADIEGVSSSFVVELRASGLEFDVPADRTVLESLRAVGVEVMSDCEEGVCGSCETPVLAGQIDHRDFVLTAQERADSDCMMVCVSRAASPRIVLDL